MRKYAGQLEPHIAASFHTTFEVWALREPGLSPSRMDSVLNYHDGGTRQKAFGGSEKLFHLVMCCSLSIAQSTTRLENACTSAGGHRHEYSTHRTDAFEHTRNPKRFVPPLL